MWEIVLLDDRGHEVVVKIIANRVDDAMVKFADMLKRSVSVRAPSPEMSKAA